MLIKTDYRALHTASQDGLPLAASDGVVVIGNFDGVHRGHQALLAHARQMANEMGAPMAVLTFSPHPRFYFKPDEPPFKLTDAVQKHELLKKAGADAIVELKFDALLSSLPPEEFVEIVLADGMRARHVVVGDNFAFGRGRKGNLPGLKKMAKTRLITVTGFRPIADFGHERISSENIRRAIRNGQMATAEDGLGHPWQIRSEVVRGQQRGRTIGFPTANLALEEYLQPKFGVYTAKIKIEGEQGLHRAVMNIGIRPSFGGIGANLEAHLLDYTGDLYGKILRVDFGDFLRPEVKFSDLNALKEQIDKDVARARMMLI
ncbi:MAG: ribF [Alphaproteobacteria bacterium]|nr:ribF [Alphaproteobacteria bacterium]